MKKLFTKLDKNKNGTLEGSEFECLFTVLDIPGISSEDVLLLNSYLDENKNGLIEYEESFEQANNKNNVLNSLSAMVADMALDRNISKDELEIRKKEILNK